MISESELDALQRELSGAVLRPEQAAYRAAVQIDNGRVKLLPRVIVQANSVPDVQATLRFARKHGLPLTVKGGGHSAAGYCLNSGGVVLDLSLMTAIALDRKRRQVTVQMGTRWHDVYVYLIQSAHGLIPIGGGCPTVGIPGFMQGGGFSFVSRSYGMSIDNLVAMTLVTVDGEVHTLSDEAPSQIDRDLFWACRGGGGGNWGVAVDMTIQVHQPNTPKMLTGGLRYTPDRAQEVLGFYNQWVETLPHEMALYGIWGMSPDPSNPATSIQTFGSTAIYNGEFSKGVKLLQPLLELGPITVALNEVTLPQFELINGASTLVDNRSATSARASCRPARSPPRRSRCSNATWRACRRPTASLCGRMAAARSRTWRRKPPPSCIAACASCRK